jgi:hypothetical protein
MESHSSSKSFSSSGHSSSSYELRVLANILKHQYGIDINYEGAEKESAVAETESAVAQTFSGQSGGGTSGTSGTSGGGGAPSSQTTGSGTCNPNSSYASCKCESTSCITVSTPCWGCEYDVMNNRHCCCETGKYKLVSCTSSYTPPPIYSSWSSWSSSSGLGSSSRNTSSSTSSQSSHTPLTSQNSGASS